MAADTFTIRSETMVEAESADKALDAVVDSLYDGQAAGVIEGGGNYVCCGFDSKTEQHWKIDKRCECCPDFECNPPCKVRPVSSPGDEE